MKQSAACLQYIKIKIKSNGTANKNVPCISFLKQNNIQGIVTFDRDVVKLPAHFIS